jgi:hypothetical protein
MFSECNAEFDKIDPDFGTNQVSQFFHPDETNHGRKSGFCKESFIAVIQFVLLKIDSLRPFKHW